MATAAKRGALRALGLTMTVLVVGTSLLASGPATAAPLHLDRCAETPPALPGVLAGACVGLEARPRGPQLSNPLDYVTLWGCYHVYVDGWYWGIYCFEPW